MSTARQADRLSETAVIPTVPVRRSILHPARPAPRNDGATFAGWRDRAPTEELGAVTRGEAARDGRAPSRRTAASRHLRCALVGTLLAVVAVTGLSSYAAQGVASSLQTAPCQARTPCR